MGKKNVPRRKIKSIMSPWLEEPIPVSTSQSASKLQKPQGVEKYVSKKTVLCREKVFINTNNWEVYRPPLEEEEHWQLRRAFLEKNCSVLPEDELLCYAQLFLNVELLHCRYPAESMKRLAELSTGISKEYNHSRAFMLKRTFVSASDAAASKVRRADPVVTSKCDDVVDSENNKSEESVLPAHLMEKLRKNVIIMYDNFTQTKETFNRISSDLKIHHATSARDDGTFEGRADFGGFTIGTAISNNSKLALKKSADTALEFLTKHCYGILRKKCATQVEGIAVIEKSNANASAAQNNKDSSEINSDNVGFKMMAKLGWTGGSLGIRGDGITNPVAVNQKVGRRGLGEMAGEVKLDSAMIKQKLNDLRNGKIAGPIVFSNEYTKQDRCLIHQVASQLRLKSHSYGKESDGSRQLVVSMRMMEPRDLLRKIMIEKDPIYTEMYEIHYPSSLQHL